MIDGMNVLLWRLCIAHVLPQSDVLGTRVEEFAGVTYPDELLLPLLLATARFGCGLALWPTKPAWKGVPHAALA